MREPLEIIHIDEWDGEQNYDEWKNGVLEQLGLPAGTWIPGMPYEFAWVEGSLYKRGSGGVFFSKVYGPRGYPSEICECGSSAFELWVGSYEVAARCIHCGKEEEVYS
jgi:hypothetical protein